MAAPHEYRYRLTDRYIVHEGCRPLFEGVERLVPEDAEYVVFDLDRTVHLDVTIGERIGWEIMVDPALRDSDADAEQPFFRWRRPLRSFVRLARGAHYWGLPGLVYAATVRLGGRWEPWHRLLMRTMGPGYVERVQGLLRSVLMASQAGYTAEQLERFAERAWRRWSSRLVVDASVIEAIRARCPRLRAVLLSSASTTPTVEHAAGKLGVDGFVASAVDLYPSEGKAVFSAPVGIPRWFRRGQPCFFSRPGAVLHNSAINKVSLLRMRYPQVFAPGTVSVGITDNNYGEDRSWTDHFSHVVALNSRHPFSPFVAAASPCRSIASADAAPVAAADASAGGVSAWLGTLRARVVDGSGLTSMFGDEELGRLDGLIAQLRATRERAAGGVDESIRRRLVAIGAAVGETVDRYNAASKRQKARIAREMNRQLRRARRLRAQLEQASKASWATIHRIEQLHDAAARTIAARQARA